MHVFVAGATGVIGKRVVERLVERGHDVVGLSRDPEGHRAVEARGGEARRGDVLEPGTLGPAMAGADAVVNLATKIPTDPVADRSDWEQNDRVRREGAANLLDAAAAAGVDHFVNESVVWVARPPGGGAFDVGSPRNPTAVTESAADAERAVLDGDHPFGTGVVRNGFLYAPDAAHTRTFARQLLARDLPILGTGLLGRDSARISVVHAADAATAAVEALEHRVEGIVHAVDDEPVPYATFLREFAQLLGAPSPRQLPGWLLRPLVGSQPVRFATTEMATSNERLCEETDWTPQFSTYREGLEQVIGELEADGLLRRTDGTTEWIGNDAANAPDRPSSGADGSTSRKDGSASSIDGRRGGT